MRFIVTVVCAAILLFLVYLVVCVVADGYLGANIPHPPVPDSWAAPDSWSEWRDIMIVVLGLFWMLAGVLTVALLVVLILVALAVRRLVKENAAPALDSLKDSLDNLRGTTEFVGETAVSPIIRMYSVVKGVRSGVGAVTHLPDRVRRRKKSKK